MIALKKLKIAIFLSLLIVSLGNVVLSSAIEFEGKIHKNVYVRDINLSNLTKEQAVEKINNMLNKKTSFCLIFNNEKILFNKNDIETNYHVQKLVEKAYGIGRDKNIMSNIKMRTNLSRGEKIILDYNITYNKEKLDKYINEISKTIYEKPVSANIKIINNKIEVSKDKSGYKIDKNKLENIIVEKINNIDNKNEIIPTLLIKPLYSYSDLSKINTVLGSFETYFNVNNHNRVTNIELAANVTSNVILNKGEVFSFNSNIKNSNINKYLKEAPVIVNGRTQKGIGGGMCQVSTTIYNAALYSGLKIVSVRNHSIPSAYIEKGRDATVSSGVIDLKLSNDFDSPVYIYNQVIGNKIVCTIYGDKKYISDIEVVTKTTDIIHNKITRKNSEDYDLGVKIIEQEGRKGYKVKTYRIYKDKSKNTEYIGESYYPPQDKIIIYGTRELRK